MRGDRAGAGGEVAVRRRAETVPRALIALAIFSPVLIWNAQHG